MVYITRRGLERNIGNHIRLKKLSGKLVHGSLEEDSRGFFCSANGTHRPVENCDFIGLYRSNGTCVDYQVDLLGI